MASKKHEMVFNEIDKTVRRSLGNAFCDDQEMAIRKAIISAFIAYENFDYDQLVVNDPLPTSE